MRYVMTNAWALLLGILLLMLGNGLQPTLLAVRGGAEDFGATTMSIVMAGYFAGFLIGSRVAPELIRRVGHVRVFAALGSVISAIFVLYAAFPDPILWTIMRIAVGFCFSGVYVVAESWLNNIATNETRGQALSAYLIVQMLGLIGAQALLNIPDPSGYFLFILISVSVSISFAPILLSVSPAPAFEATEPMGLRELWATSPLGCFGIVVLGGVFAAQFGMAGVYATEVGMTLQQTSFFIGAIYTGGLLLQYPLGYLSDRMDRRMLIASLTGFGAVITAGGILISNSFPMVLGLAFVMGAVANPLYSLLIAYTNDYLDHERMAAASGGMIFLNGLGAIAGPIVVGWFMSTSGTNAYFGFIGLLFALISLYALFRMTRRPAPSVDDTQIYAPVSQASTVVAVELAQEHAIEVADEAAEEGRNATEQGENDTDAGL